MVTDALAPYAARISTAMLLNIRYKQVAVFHKERFQLPAPTPHWEIIANANTSLCLLKQIHHNIMNMG